MPPSLSTPSLFERYLSELALGETVYISAGSPQETYPFPKVELTHLQPKLLQHVTTTHGRFHLDLTALESDVNVCIYMIYYMLRKQLPDEMLPSETDPESVAISIRSWWFCDRLDIAQLQDKIMRHIILSMQYYDIPSKAMLLAFQLFAQGSMLRKLFAEYVSVRLHSDRMAKDQLKQFQDIESFGAEYKVARTKTKDKSMTWVYDRFHPEIVGGYEVWPSDPGNDWRDLGTKCFVMH